MPPPRRSRPLILNSMPAAKRGLEENAKLIDPDKQKVMWNLNAALLQICEALDRLSQDVSILHNKIQPILRQISDDADDTRRWQDHC